MFLRVSKYPFNAIFLLMPCMQILENATALGKMWGVLHKQFVLLKFIELVMQHAN